MEKPFVDALIFVRDLLLHTVLAPGPCLCIVKRLGPDSSQKGLLSALGGSESRLGELMLRIRVVSLYADLVSEFCILAF